MSTTDNSDTKPDSAPEKKPVESKINDNDAIDPQFDSKKKALSEKKLAQLAAARRAKAAKKAAAEQPVFPQIGDSPPSKSKNKTQSFGWDDLIKFGLPVLGLYGLYAIWNNISSAPEQLNRVEPMIQKAITQAQESHQNIRENIVTAPNPETIRKSVAETFIHDETLDLLNPQMNRDPNMGILM